MSNPNIRIKRSAVPGKRPDNSQMELGELALNTNDGRLFTKKESVGIGTTVTLLNVWTENIGGGVYYNDGYVGIGTTNPITQLNLSGFSTNNSNLKIGSLEFQNYSLNNSFFGDNVYWNGSAMVRRSSGYAGLFYFFNNEGQFRLSPVGFANSETNNNPQLKINSDGGFGIGSSLSQNPNNFTGANFYVNSGGSVLVGSISSTGTINQKFQVNGGAYISNDVGIGTTNPTSKLHIVGDVLVSGIITSTDYNSASDINLKENIQPISDPIDKVMRISGVSFDWKETGRSSLGVIAQQVEMILPELVSGEESKTVNYNGLIGLLIEVVKEQQREINILKEKLQ